MSDRLSSVAMVSGGLDSLVSLAEAVRVRDVRLVLFFDYGQRARDGERVSARSAADFYGLPFGEVDLRWMESLAPAGMRRSGAADAPVQRLDDVWVPNRNGGFVYVAAAFAEARGCATVVTGFNREEAEEFPDNSAGYVERVNAGLALSTRNGVRVESFTIDRDKRDIIRRGMELRAPLSILWSCYRAGDGMCGTCASCARLKAALASLPAAERPVIEFDA
jgi:7-cyano-7-deazaguanine synthase